MVVMDGLDFFCDGLQTFLLLTAGDLFHNAAVSNNNNNNKTFGVQRGKIKLKHKLVENRS